MRAKGVCRGNVRVWLIAAAGLVAVACGDRASESSKSTAVVGASATPAVARKDFAILINHSPLFESQDGWGSGFGKAIGHGPGVVVGPGALNPNVFAQQFATKAGGRYKIVARASSVNMSKAVGRFQVNWTDVAGRFISTSIMAFEVTPEERAFETIVEAPVGAAGGTIYVVGNGPHDVIRYTEMRLLGQAVGDMPPNPSSNGKPAGASSDPFPRPSNLTPLAGTGRTLTVAESQFYFYHAVKAMQRRAKEGGADFIMFVMPDFNISRLWPAIKQLRSEGIKVLAYEPEGNWRSGVDTDWYWQKADSHWTEAAVRLTADEILNMWKNHRTANRPFSNDLMSAYTGGFPVENGTGATAR